MRNSSGSTPLHVAAYYGSRDMINLLLECGAAQTERNMVTSLWYYDILIFPRSSLMGQKFKKAKFSKTNFCWKILLEKSLSHHRHLQPYPLRCHPNKNMKPKQHYRVDERSQLTLQDIFSLAGCLDTMPLAGANPWIRKLLLVSNLDRLLWIVQHSPSEE